MKTAVVIALFVAAAVPAGAQSLVPGPNQPGRYQMQPVEGGVARLDTVTGDVSLCRVERGALRCRPSEDADAAQPPRDDDAEGDGGDAPSRDPGYSQDEPSTGSDADADKERPERGDTTDAELDKAIGRVKRVFRAFRDIAREFDHEETGKEQSPDRT